MHCGSFWPTQTMATVHFAHSGRLGGKHAPQELVLRSSGKKIAPGFIRPYAICETPPFVNSKHAVSTPGRDHRQRQPAKRDVLRCWLRRVLAADDRDQRRHAMTAKDVLELLLIRWPRLSRDQQALVYKIVEELHNANARAGVADATKLRGTR